MANTSSTAEPDVTETTLTKAVMRAADRIGVNRPSLARILGMSASTVSRMYAGQYRLRRERRKEWDLAVLLVRLYRALDAVLGHGDTNRTWLASENLSLSGKPVELIQTAEGLVRVLHYLDAHRGR